MIVARASRDTPYAAEKAASSTRKMAAAVRQPRNIPEYVAWLRAEFSAEVPGRIHERGVEPESALGAPALAGAFRAYMYGSPLATDHDDAKDATTRGAARQRPIHAALTILGRKRPFTARYLFAVAVGVDWDDSTLIRHLHPEVQYGFALDALRHLWHVWGRDAVDVAREVV